MGGTKTIVVSSIGDPTVYKRFNYVFKDDKGFKCQIFSRLSVSVPVVRYLHSSDNCVKEVTTLIFVPISLINLTIGQNYDRIKTSLDKISSHIKKKLRDVIPLHSYFSPTSCTTKKKKEV